MRACISDSVTNKNRESRKIGDKLLEKPDIPFFDQKKDWPYSVGALYYSTVVHYSNLSRLLQHDIMVHIPHHLDTRIPFYHLPEAYQALKKEYSCYFHEYRFRWRYVFSIFKQ